jgi:hypothetical protein
MQSRQAAPRASGPRRRKVALACEPCRERKSRCDGQKPMCGPCARRSYPIGRCIYKSDNARSASNDECVAMDDVDTGCTDGIGIWARYFATSGSSNERVDSRESPCLRFELRITNTAPVSMSMPCRHRWASPTRMRRQTPWSRSGRQAGHLHRALPQQLIRPWKTARAIPGRVQNIQ